MKTPKYINVTIRAAGRPVSHMLAMFRFVMAQKNPYNFAFGPSDRNGQIHVKNDQILAEAKNSRELFLMDYTDIECAWTGQLIMTPMNREAIKRALKAFKTYRSYSYPSGYKEALDRAHSALHGIRASELTASVECDPMEGVRIETIAVRA